MPSVLPSVLPASQLVLGDTCGLTCASPRLWHQQEAILLACSPGPRPTVVDGCGHVLVGLVPLSALCVIILGGRSLGEWLRDRDLDGVDGQEMVKAFGVWLLVVSS